MKDYDRTEEINRRAWCGVAVMLLFLVAFIAITGEHMRTDSYVTRVKQPTLTERVACLEQRISELEAKTGDRLQKMAIDINNNSAGHNDMVDEVYTKYTEGFKLSNQCFNGKCHGVNKKQEEPLR